MNRDQAIDAAILAFLDHEDSEPLRTRLTSAVAAYTDELTTCQACSGTGKLTVRSDNAIWLAKGYGREDRPVPKGEQFPCACCDGSGRDPAHVVWACTAASGRCVADEVPRHQDHEMCGWAQRVPSRDSKAQQPR